MKNQNVEQKKKKKAGCFCEASTLTLQELDLWVVLPFERHKMKGGYEEMENVWKQ